MFNFNHENVLKVERYGKQVHLSVASGYNIKTIDILFNCNYEASNFLNELVDTCDLVFSAQFSDIIIYISKNYTTD